MKKLAFFSMIFICLIGFTSFDFHKFYVSIYQINYNQKQKRLEITSRIFIDDLNAVLKLKYNKKTNLASTEETLEDVDLMKKYILENFSIKINGIAKPLNYLSKEIEANVLICYFNIKEINKIKSLEIKNSALLDLNSDQQNIIQTTIYNKKQSLLLTDNDVKGFIKTD